MKKIKSLDICVIGAGKLGSTISCMLAKKSGSGIRLTAVASKSTASLNRAAGIMGNKAKGVVFTKKNKKAASLADCVLICTPDDVIGPVCSEVYTNKNIRFSSYYALHFSGSKSLSVLDSAKRAGAKVASMHPLKSFASIKEAIKTLPGTVFGITYCSAESKGIAQIIEHPFQSKGQFILYAGLSAEGMLQFGDLYLYDASASFVIYDGDQQINSGNWEGDADLIWKF